MAEFTPVEVARNLQASRSRPSSLVPPEKPGVYAVCLRDKAQVGWFTCKPGDIIYVGISSNLKQREFDTHFTSGKSGFSTLRRSLGAILKGELQLECFPRSSGKAESNVTNYKFDPAGEQRLTLWMAENLDIGICPVGSSIKELETAVIADLEPLLNLTKWKNPNRKEIMGLRLKCKAEAESNRS